VEILLTLKTFKINISFKRVGIARLDKVIITANVPRINKGII
jgi:hypothetical protein